MMYQFTYPDKNITQQKILVSHDDYLKYKEMQDGDEKDSFWHSVTNGKEWFTDKSPYFDAIKTGVLNCNGSFPCVVALIE